MSASAKTEWILELKQNLTQQLDLIDEHLQENVKHTKELSGSLKKMTAIDLYAISNAFQDVSEQLNNAIAPGIKFQDGLADVEAITGVTGKALDELGAKARKSAKQFGGEASDSLNTYKVILSRLGPDIAKNQKALAGMENNARILSKTMDNDLGAATDALTTAMLQYKVDLSDPMKANAEMTKMMNVMAAGAKEGSAEIPSISQALKVAGVQAKQSKLSFVETNAALQELARGGKEGSEAGMGLRNILGKMAGEDVIPKETVNKLKSLGVNMNIVSNTSLPFTERLRELKKAQADATLIAQVFGVENAATANILLDSIDAQDKLQSKIKGTNTAFEQAEVKMNTYSEWLSRTKAKIKDVSISLFGIGSTVAPTITIMAELGRTYVNFKNILDVCNISIIRNTRRKIANSIANNGYIGSMKLATRATWNFIKAQAAKTWNFVKNIALTGVGAVGALGSYIIALATGTAAQWSLNTAVAANPIGAFIVGLMAVIGVVALIVKYWDSWGASLTMVAGLIGAFFSPIIAGFAALISVVMSFKRNWEHITSAFKDGGILAGLKAIGLTLIDAILMPVQQLLELVSKIPGMQNIAGDAATSIAEMRKGLFAKEENADEDISAEDYQKALYVDKDVQVKQKEQGLLGKLSDFVLGNNDNNTTNSTNNNDNTINGTGSSGGNKALTMNLEIKNIFNAAKGENADEMARKVTERITAMLQDGMLAIA